MSSPTREDLLPALKRFNRWQFIEAQGYWKELAEQAEGSDREFLAAMSDLSGGFAKIWHKGGEPHAMVALLTKGIENLTPFRSVYLKIRVDPFIDELNRCLVEAKRWRRGDTEIFNRDLIPRIDFTG